MKARQEVDYYLDLLETDYENICLAWNFGLNLLKKILLMQRISRVGNYFVSAMS